MLVSYALVHYIGAVTAAKKGDDFSVMMLGSRQIPLWIPMLPMLERMADVFEKRENL